jgi:TPR repeat protein
MDVVVVCCLADTYFGGLGVPRAPQKGFQLWKRLADLDNDEAQDVVGYFYLPADIQNRDGAVGLLAAVKGL